VDKRFQEIEQLYHEALKKPEGERFAFLQQTCADEELRQEVVGLLACLNDGNFMDTPALDVAAKMLACSPDATWVGTQLGVFQVLSLIGAGGMGEVYLARDSRLDRQVAIKILPQAFTADPERLSRFEREAKLLASLNHPNIASIFGFEAVGEKRFLVMELVEGETLAEKLSRGPLPIGEALELSRQIAEGVEAAHEKGIVHRDLKPANVKITHAGNVKILDFGLAKVYQKEDPAPDLSQSPMLAKEMTQEGMILGTAAYMSPEQVKGKAVDKRTDVWSFGCVLYECLAGKRAFEGETVAEKLAAILKEEPHWQALPIDTPREVMDLLHRCLRKDPRDRLHDIADVRIEIVEALSQPHAAQPVEARAVHQAWKIPVLILSVLFVGIIAAVITWHVRTPPSASRMQFTIDLTAGTQLTQNRSGPTRTELALSPDGTNLVYSASTDGSSSKARLYLRPTSRNTAQEIPGTEEARIPFFSPNGEWIGFWARGKLFKVSLGGGIPIALCDFGEMPMGASWGSNGSIVLGTEVKGLQSIDANGGKPRGLTLIEPTKEMAHRLPHFLPGGKAVLFTVMPQSWGIRGRIEVLELDSGKRKVLIDEGMDARYVPTGHLIYLREGTLMAAPFDLERLEMRGSALPAVEGVMQAINATLSQLNSGAGQFSLSRSGCLVYVSGGTFPDPEVELVWVDRRGKVEPMVSFGARPVATPRLSPDGQKLAFFTVGRNSDLWVYDIPRGTSTKLTSEGRVTSVDWTPDGTRLTFGFSKAGVFNIYWMPWDGSRPMEQLTKSEHFQLPASWSPDGQVLSFIDFSSTKSLGIWMFRKDNLQASPFLVTKFIEASPEFSPDGKWLAHDSNESGRFEVYVTPFPVPGQKTMISNEGGRAPLWSRNGRELFYWDLASSKLMVVEVTTQPAFYSSRPRVLFEFRSVFSSPLRNYEISLDNQRFLISKRPEFKPVAVTQLNIVLNWFEELKRIVPTGRN
jgi:eukaryotic-like serine/threonine-protein kinase